MLTLPGTVLSETATSITIGWDAPPEQVGVLALVDGDGVGLVVWSLSTEQVTIVKPTDETLPATKHTYGVLVYSEFGEVLYTPPPPAIVPPHFLFDARIHHGLPFGQVFPVVQKSNGSYQTQGKSHMVDAAWAQGGGKDVLRFSSPGFPSGPSPVPGVQWFERVQMGDKRTFAVGERCCYLIGFRIKQGMDVFGQDLASEVVFQDVASRGPTHSLKVLPGFVQYFLSAGETTPSSVSGPAFEVNASNARDPKGNTGVLHAVPPSRLTYGAFNIVLLDMLLKPDWTGWVDVHHMVDGGLPWAKTASVVDLPTLQCLKDGQRTVPSLNIMDLINLYLIAKPGYKERDYVLLARGDSADQMKAWWAG